MTFHNRFTPFHSTTAPRGSIMFSQYQGEYLEYILKQEILRQARINHYIFSLAAFSCVFIAWIGLGFFIFTGNLGGIVAAGGGGYISWRFCINLAEQALAPLKLLSHDSDEYDSDECEDDRLKP
jgi:hypothetical protein